MSEQTTMRLSKETKRRLRGYAKHPRATDDEVLIWILDKLEEEGE